MKNQLSYRKERTYVSIDSLVKQLIVPLNKIAEAYSLPNRFSSKLTKANNLNVSCSHCETIMTFTLAGKNCKRVKFNRFYHGLASHFSKEDSVQRHMQA